MVPSSHPVGTPWFRWVGGAMLGFLGTIFVGMAAYVQRDPVSFVATHQLELPTNDAKAEARAYYAGTLLPLGLLWLAAAVDSSVVPSAAAAKLTDDEDEGDREDAAGGVRRRLAGFSAAGAAKRRRGATPTPRGRRRGKAAQAASSDGSSSDDGDNGGDDDDSGITDDTRDGPSPLANVSVVPRRLGLAVGVGVLWTFCYQRFVALAHDGRPTQQAQLLQLGEFLGGAVCFVAWLGETAHARGTFVWKMLRKTLRDMVHHSADPAEPLVSFGITGLLWLALYVWTPTYTRVTSIAAAGAIVARSMLGYVATYGSAWYVFEKLHVDKPHKFGPRYHNDGLHKKEWMRWASACLIGALWDVFLSWLWTRGYLQTPPEAASANAAPSEAFSGYFAAYSWAALPRILGVILLADLHFYSVHRLLHLGPMYTHVHYMHHQSRNTNVISGLSFHPVESLLYFSSTACAVVLLPFQVHRLEYLLAKAILDFTPIFGHNGQGHAGGGSFYHWLHHTKRHYNFGGTPMFDALFGTVMHDTRPAGGGPDPAMKRA